MDCIGWLVMQLSEMERTSVTHEDVMALVGVEAADDAYRAE
jgi:hypothetical protein